MTLALDGVSGSVTPRPRFTPWERTLDTRCTGGWVDTRAGLDTEATGKIICICRDRTLVVQSVVRHYTRGSQTVGPPGGAADPLGRRKLFV
jgi:hypothetical protein